MDYNTELYGFYKQVKMSEALHLTCELIFTNKFEIIQKTFIRAIACIGEYTDICFLKWHECIKDIVSFIKDENVDIYLILRITSKICILFKNTVHYNTVPKTSITQLRAKTISYFEDNTTKLSKKGEDFFDPILPKAINERVFILKIFGSLLKLWNDKKHLEFRDAIEYLTRKDYVIESIHTNIGSSIVALLWEFMNLYEPMITTNIYTLYKTDYKKKDKLWRNSLLFGIHNYLNGVYNIVLWTQEEYAIIKKSDVVAKELWARILKNEEISIDKMKIFDTYCPTKLEQNDDTGADEYRKDPRTIRFN